MWNTSCVTLFSHSSYLGISQQCSKWNNFHFAPPTWRSAITSKNFLLLYEVAWKPTFCTPASPRQSALQEGSLINQHQVWCWRAAVSWRLWGKMKAARALIEGSTRTVGGPAACIAAVCAGSLLFSKSTACELKSLRMSWNPCGWNKEGELPYCKCKYISSFCFGAKHQKSKAWMK